MSLIDIGLIVFVHSIIKYRTAQKIRQKILSVFAASSMKISPQLPAPIRFRQDWIITDHAARFFFPHDVKWTTLTEVRLNDFYGKTAGNIDVVLVSYDEKGKVCDFGALEIQAVYISGNIRSPFEYYMGSPKKRANMDWTEEPNYPRPDYLSSSRKRLAPQLLFKGGILNT